MELPEDERFVVSVTQDEATSTVHHLSLAISDVTTQDAGTYRVQATNDLGQESVSVSLIVNSKLCLYPSLCQQAVSLFVSSEICLYPSLSAVCLSLIVWSECVCVSTLLSIVSCVCIPLFVSSLSPSLSAVSFVCLYSSLSAVCLSLIVWSVFMCLPHCQQ